MGNAYISSDPLNFKKSYLPYLIYPFLANFFALFWPLNYHTTLSGVRKEIFVLWVIINCFLIIVFKISRPYFPSVKHLMAYTLEHPELTFNSGLGTILLYAFILISLMNAFFQKSIWQGVQFFLFVSIMYSPLMLVLFSTDLYSQVRKFRRGLVQ